MQGVLQWTSSLLLSLLGILYDAVSLAGNSIAIPDASDSTPPPPISSQNDVVFPRHLSRKGSTRRRFLTWYYRPFFSLLFCSFNSVLSKEIKSKARLLFFFFWTQERREQKACICGCVYHVVFAFCCVQYLCNVIFTYPNYPGLSIATSALSLTALRCLPKLLFFVFDDFGVWLRVPHVGLAIRVRGSCSGQPVYDTTQLA